MIMPNSVDISFAMPSLTIRHRRNKPLNEQTQNFNKKNNFLSKTKLGKKIQQQSNSEEILPEKSNPGTLVKFN